MREGEQGEKKMSKKQDREMRKMREKQEVRMRQMMENQEREMKEMMKRQEDEKTQMEMRLKVQEEEKKESLFKLKKTVEDLTKELQHIEVDSGMVTCGVVKEARGHLECPICLEWMRPPTRIWQCPQSHLVCETCRQQLENFRCPSCRTETVSIRARVAENMAKALFENQ